MEQGLENIPESELWHFFKNGNKDAFALIYQRYVNVLYNYGRKVVNDPDIVKDNIQELFVELWHGRNNLSNTNSIKFYLYKALRIKILKNLKRQNRQFTRHDLLESQDLGLVFSFETQLIQLQLSEEQQIQIKETLKKLSDKQREIIYLRFYDDFSYQEIADILDINLQSVHNLLHRTLKILREHLNLTFYTFILIIIFL